jgi:2-dehydropantoate 2-reductase
VTRYVILGAGAVGGALGGRLAQAGRDVVLIGRGEHLAAMRRDGLRLRTPEEDITLPVTVAAAPGDVDLRPDDLLVATAKTQQLGTLLPAWADAPVRNADQGATSAGESLPMLTATNGVAAEDLALRYFARVYGVCVWMPASRLVPGEVIARGTPVSGVLHVGRVPAALAVAGDETLRQVSSDWTAARFTVHSPEDVMAWKYRKLISNLGNVFEALAGRTKEVRPLFEAADREARTVLDAAGVGYTSDEEESATRSAGFSIGRIPGVEEHLGGSTWQSLTRGTGDIETDYLNGEIARLAHQHGLRAPINTRLAALGRQAAAAGWKPGEVSPAELAAALQLPAP